MPTNTVQRTKGLTTVSEQNQTDTHGKKKKNRTHGGKLGGYVNEGILCGGLCVDRHHCNDCNTQDHQQTWHSAPTGGGLRIYEYPYSELCHDILAPQVSPVRRDPLHYLSPKSASSFQNFTQRLARNRTPPHPLLLFP